MSRLSTTAFALTLAGSTFAQQIALDWATEVVSSNSRVKVAASGGVFALGGASSSALIQRVSAAGSPLWTITLPATTVIDIDMDVDASDNVYVYLGLSSGQLDLDPGPLSTIVGPGKVYAKYNSEGLFQWGFVIPSIVDMSEDHGGISVDDAGNLYISGNVGSGSYDFDPGPGMIELVCPSGAGSFVARYRSDGSLVFADLRAWQFGFSSSHDIAVTPNGDRFFMVQTLDSNGSPAQIDVDPGPDVFTVSDGTQSILCYDSTFAFIGQAYTDHGDLQVCADGFGAAFLMARNDDGTYFVAEKYTGPGPVLVLAYSTPLLTVGTLRLGDVAPDGQGGFLGLYNNNCDPSKIRFFKVDASGTVEFNLFLDSGTECIFPGGKGFDVDGNSFYIGTYTQNQVADFDPGPDVLALPTIAANDGVLARYQWCTEGPIDPLGISAQGALCVGTPATFSVSAFGDASSYAWTPSTGWTILEGQGTATITVLSDVLSSGAISVSAVNNCGTSAPISLDFSLNNPPVADLGPDLYACVGDEVILFANPPGATYLWSDGSTNVSLAANAPGVYGVEVTVNGCSDSDEVTVEWQPLPSVELGPDQVICPGESVVLDAGNPGAEYQWFPEGFGSQQTIIVTPDSTTDYTVFVNVGGCIGLDAVAIIVDPCLGMGEARTDGPTVWPVPVSAGEFLHVRGLSASDVLGLFSTDGRTWPLHVTDRSGVLRIATSGMPPGAYVLRVAAGATLRVVLR